MSAATVLKTLQVINAGLDLIATLENADRVFGAVSDMIARAKTEGRALTDEELRAVVDSGREALNELDAALDYAEGGTPAP